MSKSNPPAKNDNPVSGGKGVEVGADEQKKLEDIRKKLKDIFVTAEKAPAPKVEETVKAGDAQTASSGLLDLRDIAKNRKAQTQAESEPRVDDDMLLLSGGLFDAGRGHSSLGPPDLSLKAPPAPKPPPPTRASKPDLSAHVDEVDVDVEPESHADGDLLISPASRPQLAPVALGSALAAPPKPAPVDDVLAPVKKPMSPRTMTAIAIALAAVVGGVFFVMMRGGDEAHDGKEQARTGSEVSAQTTAGATDPQPSAAPPESSAAAESAPVNAVVPGSKAAAAATTTAKSEPAGATTKSPSAKAPGEKDPAPTGAPASTKTEASPAPTPTPTPAATPPPLVQTAPPSAGDEFDKGAASAALNSAASAAMSCKGDGPSGSATVSVTFAPSGRVTSATVSGSFAGTPAGGCIAQAFRRASVPKFGGSPVTVTKKVSIR